MLEVSAITMKFGGVTALDDVNFRVEDGEVLGVIGPNGSGKSTLINVISGFYRPTSGAVTLDGASLSHLPPERVRREGLVRTFQNLRLVDEMTVLENCLAGVYPMLTTGYGFVGASLASLLGLPVARRRAWEADLLAREALHRVDLEHRLNDRVSELSYAEQKRLEIARSIALKPRYLILDEPTAGMGVDEADHLVRMIVQLARDPQQPMALFLVEHRLELVLDVSDRAIVMDGGRVLADGPAEEIAVSQVVRDIYVGGE
ncbi:ABC transporter ATP-binding protein [Leucobacter rhizosphaerae]|uniref:ABC transporter ATP-binding protein n=1 Tax=Leucobacter rhizosphaerae TaxID=2932245 RepID=A0ABY4FU48_9MICO|nr:ABC transporter ATP-binding protein [Leucobacter rhizosphaerae]UOQ59824.1 ABC transporter ATP-binding protein [Leucobacter rhizosphaerae]